MKIDFCRDAAAAHVLADVGGGIATLGQNLRQVVGQIAARLIEMEDGVCVSA